MARVWIAEHHESETVGELLCAFRDSFGKAKPSDNVILAGVEKLIELPETEFLLGAVDEDAPAVGVIQLRFRPSVWTASPDCWLEDLFVDPSARRQGVADALMTLALDRARARGARRIELDTWQSNASAIALYRRHGFSERSKGNDSIDLFFGAKLGELA